MNFWDKMHFLHRAWRYRLVSEKFGVSFLLSLDLQDCTVIDIGANRGIYSYWMNKKVGLMGRVIAFEPQPELNKELYALKNEFAMHRLEIAEVGLSSSNKTVKMYRPKDHWGGATIEGNTKNGSIEELEVKVKTLDSYLAKENSSRIRFIKCDVEGHEFAALKGGIQTIKREKPEILLECHDALNPNCATFKLLKEINYQGYCFFKGGITAIENYGHLKEKGLLHRKATDFIFAHKDRLQNLPLKLVG